MPIYQLRIKAFTLMEMVITVAIMGILMGISIPSYRFFMDQSKKIEAENNAFIFHQAMLSLMSDSTINNIYNYPLKALSTDIASETTKTDNFTIISFRRFIIKALENANISDNISIQSDDYELAIIDQNSGVGISTYHIIFDNTLEMNFRIRIEDYPGNGYDIGYFLDYTFLDFNGYMCQLTF